MNRRRVRIKQVPRHGESLGERLYIFGVMRAMGLTMRRLMTGLKGRRQTAVVEYPEMKPAIPRRWRGRHRLTLRPDGSPRCTVCGLCAETCPVSCISLSGTGRPSSFDIDLSACIFCGSCVDNCPYDAIRMDSGIFSVIGNVREDLAVNMHTLLATPGSYGEDGAPEEDEG